MIVYSGSCELNVESVAMENVPYQSPVAGTTREKYRCQLAYETERLKELHRQVVAQEHLLMSMQLYAAKQTYDNAVSGAGGDDDRDNAMKSLIKIKERELALTLMRVNELTRQLEQLRQGRLDGILVDSASSHAQLLDRSPEAVEGIIRPFKVNQQTSAMQRSKSTSDIDSKAQSKAIDVSTEMKTTKMERQLSDSSANRRNSFPTTKDTSGVDVVVSNVESCGVDVNENVMVDSEMHTDSPSQAPDTEVNDVDSDTSSSMDNDSMVEITENVESSEADEDIVKDDCEYPANDSENGITGASDTISFNLKSDLSSSVVVKNKFANSREKRLSDIMSSQQKNLQQPMIIVPSNITFQQTGTDDSLVSSADSRDTPFTDCDGGISVSHNASVLTRPVCRPSDVNISQQSNVSSFAGNGQTLSVNTIVPSSKHSEPRIGMSSGFRQRLSPQGAGRYSAISDRLYGDWLNPSTLSNRSPESGTDSSPVLISSPVSPSAASDFHLPESPTPKTSSNDVVHHSTKQSTDVCGTHGCDRADVNDESDDSDNYDDDYGQTVGQFTGATDSLRPRRGDSFLKKDIVRWRQRLVASPPPRRVAHVLRKADDALLETTESEVSVSRNLNTHSSKHVTFDLFTLCLNAALEGELETLRSSFNQMSDVNQANEDGLTVLHNGVCSGSLDVLEYLVNAGCDVNVADCDGWTPLHCAASSNNVEAARLLVEHGASLFAFTCDDDQEIPLQKCCQDSSGFDECYDYLTESMDMLGTANAGWVYAVADYVAANDDELSFTAGDQLAILQRGDDSELGWWWAKHSNGMDGYVPQNLLTMFPPTGLRQHGKKSLIETSC